MELDLDGPALAPPAGVIPDFDNPPNRNKLALGVLIASAVFATICVLIRAYGRIVLLRRFKTEESTYRLVLIKHDMGIVADFSCCSSGHSRLCWLP